MGRSAAFFDLDKTIIAKSSVLAFGRPFYHGGLLNRRAVLRSAYAQFVFALAGADHDQIERMRAYLTSMCAGWDVAQVREIVRETLHDIIDPIVYDEAVELIADHQRAGRDVVIVSSSGEEVVAPIGELLGADHVIATQMVVADGPVHRRDQPLRLRTGEGRTRSASWPPSATTTSRPATPTPTRSTDLPMLEAVGHPFAVNPDRALRKVAAERDWPTLTFSNAVPLRERLSGLKPARPAATTRGRRCRRGGRRRDLVRGPTPRSPAPDAQTQRPRGSGRAPCAVGPTSVQYEHRTDSSMAVQPPASSPGHEQLGHPRGDPTTQQVSRRGPQEQPARVGRFAGHAW